MLTGRSADDYQCFDYQIFGDFLRVERKALGRCNLAGGAVSQGLAPKSAARTQDLRRQAAVDLKVQDCPLLMAQGGASFRRGTVPT
jgi:hypothetical protein